ncbi:centromere protein H [Camelus ferus]|nr:centromere protein H [Camelus ferus]
MEKQSEEQAAAEPADSGGEGGPSQVVGAQAARPEDRMTLLLSKIEELEKEIEEVKIAFEMKKLALDSVLMDNMKQILNLNKLIMKLQQVTCAIKLFMHSHDLSNDFLLITIVCD